MTLTDKLSVIGKSMATYLEGLTEYDVWFGEQDTIPKLPAIVVMPTRLSREKNATGHTSLSTIEISVHVFHTDFWNPQLDREQCLKAAEEVDEFLQANRTLGGLIVDSFVTGMEPGFGENRQTNQVSVMTTMSWQGTARVRLHNSQ